MKKKNVLKDAGVLLIVVVMVLSTVMIVAGNFQSPPNKPSKPSGPTEGDVDVSYTYSTSTTDPEGDDVWYHICWGDKEIIYIYGPYPTGEEITLSYNWTDKGTYTITCWARDIYDAESNTATFEVTIPRDKPITGNLLLLRTFKRFPLLQQLWSVWRSNLV